MFNSEGRHSGLFHIFRIKIIYNRWDRWHLISSMAPCSRHRQVLLDRWPHHTTRTIFHLICNISMIMNYINRKILSFVQGYTSYGPHMGMQPHPSQAAGMGPNSYGNLGFQGAHPGTSTVMVDPLRQMQQRPSGYVHQQAPAAYAHTMQNAQRWVTYNL